MGIASKIAWTDHTWNPWTGCAPVSEGCRHCYAARWARRCGRDFSRVTRSSRATFLLPLSKKVLRGDRVFVCSLSDFFIDAPGVEDWRREATDLMIARPGVIFLLLTKRVDRMAAWARGLGPLDSLDPSVLSHIWLGVTAENQARADERIPQLLAIGWPGPRFVSIEPMIGPVWLEDYDQQLGPPHLGRSYLRAAPAIEGVCPAKPRLDWVIAGSESGSDRRADPAWYRSLRDQCVTAGVPFFLKQMHDDTGRLVVEPALDGDKWLEVPAPTTWLTNVAARGTRGARARRGVTSGRL